jgi:hypothetical protein
MEMVITVVDRYGMDKFTMVLEYQMKFLDDDCGYVKLLEETWGSGRYRPPAQRE